LDLAFKLDLLSEDVRALATSDSGLFRMKEVTCKRTYCWGVTNRGGKEGTTHRSIV